MIFILLGLGCISAPPTDSTFPEPKLGEEFVYEREDGTQMTVEVVGEQPRYDTFLEPQPSLVFNWAIAGLPNFDSVLRFQEAVDSQGRVVQHLAWCGGTLIQPDGRRECTEGPGSVAFDAAGYPGAFGAGPFWGSSLPLEEDAPREAPFFSTNGSVEVSLERLDWDVSECVEVRSQPWEQVVYAPPLEFATLGGPVTLCEDYALPVEFTTARGGTWTLQNVTRPPQAPTQGSEDQSVQRFGPLETRRAKTPLVVADETDPSAFDVEAAHEEALRWSDAYRSLFEEGDPLVVGTDYRKEGVEVGLVDMEGDRRTLFAVAENGTWVEVVVHRGRVSEAAATYEVEEEGSGTMEDPPTRETLSSEQVKLEAAIERGELLTGQPRTDIDWIRMYARTFSHSWAADGAVHSQAGPFVRSLHEDPDPQGGGGLIVMVPYTALIEGPTGAVVHTDVGWDRLPLYESIGG